MKVDTEREPERYKVMLKNDFEEKSHAQLS